MGAFKGGFAGVNRGLNASCPPLGNSLATVIAIQLTRRRPLQSRVVVVRVLPHTGRRELGLVEWLA
jgi:hypothetical protein